MMNPRWEFHLRQNSSEKQAKTIQLVTYRILLEILGVHVRSGDHREAHGVRAGIHKAGVGSEGGTDNAGEDTYDHGVVDTWDMGAREVAYNAVGDLPRIQVGVGILPVALILVVAEVGIGSTPPVALTQVVAEVDNQVGLVVDLLPVHVASGEEVDVGLPHGEAGGGDDEDDVHVLVDGLLRGVAAVGVDAEIPVEDQAVRLREVFLPLPLLVEILLLPWVHRHHLHPAGARPPLAFRRCSCFR